VGARAGSGKLMRILLVDDREIVRCGLRRLLAEAYPDAELREAARVPSAREALTHEAWRLVLLDINLPDGSGLELLAQARLLCPQTPVLALSAYPEAEFAVRALKLGTAGYLTKASLADELLLAVQRVLAGGKYVSATLAEKLGLSSNVELARYAPAARLGRVKRRRSRLAWAQHGKAAAVSVKLPTSRWPQ